MSFRLFLLWRHLFPRSPERYRLGNYRVENLRQHLLSAEVSAPLSDDITSNEKGE